MTVKSIFTLVIVALLLAACAGSTPTESAVVTQSSSQPTPYLAPIVATAAPIVPAYPFPATPIVPTPTIIPSGFEPQPGDASLTRDQVFLDMANSKILIQEGLPIQASVQLVGNLSDPCHQLRVVITPSDASNRINLEVYSVFDRGEACITVLKSFDATIPLGHFPSGHYSVYVNDQLLGEFDS